MNGKIAIEFKNVIKSFDGADYNAVDDVSFQIEEGELITVLGTSGCGKTTLLKMVNRLYEPTSGIIEIFGKAYISSQVADAIVFAVLIVVLLVRPAGLFGKNIQEKV